MTAADPSAAKRPWPRAVAAAALPACLLAGYWLMATSAWRDKCTTADEIIHLAAGYSYWLTGDMRLQPENGNLPQRWAALPLWLKGVPFPPPEGNDWRESNVWGVGETFFYGMGNDAQQLLAMGRGAVALLTVGLGIMVYVWSRSINGPAGALLSLVLFAFSPTMLSHGALATSDAAAALFFLASVAAMWRVLDRVTVGRLLVSCLALGGLLLSKMSAPLIVPMALLLVLARLWRGDGLAVPWRARVVSARLAQAGVFAGVAALHLLVGILIVWAAYGFRYSAFARAEPGAMLSPGGWHSVLDSGRFSSAVLRCVRDSQLLPEAYVYGMAHTIQFSNRRRAYMNGEFEESSFQTFFPYCLLVKTPIPLFILLLIAGGAVLARWRRERGEGGPPLRARIDQGFFATAPLWVLLLVYWVAAINSRLNIGDRHIMPTHAPMFILAGAAARGGKMPRARTVAVAGMAAWFAAESLLIRPHYLAYFNQIAGGPTQGYRRLVDSSLDWGQDLPALRRWLDAHGLNAPEAPAHVIYFGMGNPRYYGIRAPLQRCYPVRPADEVPRREALRDGTYLVSASVLSSAYTFPVGEWTDWHEKFYQARRRLAYDEAHLARIPEQDRDILILEYREARIARLCAFLRRLKPVDQIGYSILVFQLSQEDVRRALNESVIEE